MARRSSSAKHAPKPVASGPAPASGPWTQDRLDSWMNTITGMGGAVDKLAAGFVSPTRQQWQDAETLETLYYEDDLIRKYIDKKVDAAMRQSFMPHLTPSLEAVANDNGEDETGEEVKRRAEAIKRRLRELLAEEQVSKADKLGRLHGGAAVFVGCEGDPATPLDASNVGKIRRLAVYERDELQPLKWYDDPLSDDYGTVELWRLVPMGVRSRKAIAAAPVIHTSRLLRFEGLEPTRRERQKQNGWSPSIVVNAIEQVRDGQQNWRSIGLILNQAHQAVFKIENLISMITNDGEEELQKRMRVANMARSITRAVCIDADKEEFEYHSTSLGGLDVLAVQIWQRIAACFDMPVTVLMGTSPSGLSATGESDMRQWYDSIQAHREQVLGPNLERLVRFVAAELGDPSPNEWTITWPSLWQMSPPEEATYRKTVADTDAVYVNAGVVTPQEVAATRFGGGTYSAEAIQVEMDLRTPGETDPDKGKDAYEKPEPAGQVRDPAPAEGDAVTDPELAKDPGATLNGAQMGGIKDIVLSVAKRELPRSSGIAMLLIAAPIKPEVADAIMGEVGTTFFSVPPLSTEALPIAA